MNDSWGGWMIDSSLKVVGTLVDLIYIGKASSDFSELCSTLVSSSEDLSAQMRFYDLGGLGPGVSLLEILKRVMGELEKKGWKGVSSPSYSSPLPTLILHHQELAPLETHRARLVVSELKRLGFLVFVAFPCASLQYMDECLSYGADDGISMDEGISLLWRIRKASEHRVTQKALGEVRGYMEHFRQLSMYDELTGLYNMRLFRQRLKSQLTEHTPTSLGLSLLMFDVDFFKRVNDELSHLAGSQVLSQIGAVLKKHLREHDIAARFGGDEFVVILNQTKPEGTPVVALRLMEAVAREMFCWENRKIRISLSCGAASYDPATSSLDLSLGAEKLLRLADERLYEAKEKGRGRLFSGSSLVQLENDLGEPFPLTHVL